MTDTRTRRGRIAWALLALVEAPVVAAVGVGLAAAYLPPRPYWWTQLVSIGLPYAAWALAAFTVVWLLGRKWGAVAFQMLLLALVVARVGVFDRLSLPDGQEAFVLTTFNVPQVGPSREALGDSVVAYVAATRPDMVLMQDAWVVGRNERESGQAVQVEAVDERLPYTLQVPARLAGYPGWRSNATGVPLLVRDSARVEVLEQEALVLGVERDADVSQALRSHLRWGGREFVVYNLHLRSFGASKPWEDAAVRLTRPSTWRPYLNRYRGVYAQRGDETAEIAERIAQETLPVVIAGDFNSTADNWSYRALRIAGGVSRTDAFRAAGGWAWGRTYHARRPFVRIDFVLVDPALEVVSARTTPVTFSDHRPVRVGLRWRPDAE